MSAAAGTSANNRSWLPSLAQIVVLDIGGPILAYNVLHSNGSSMVTALVLSGLLPAFGVAIGVVRDRRVDAIGALVLFGIVVGTVIGLATGNPRSYLLDGSIPLGFFGVVCLGSLLTSRPLMFRFALEFKGAETPGGREFADLWQYEGFRHTFRVITTVWGIAFLAEAVANAVIVESTSTGTAYSISKVLPYIVIGIVAAWNIAYGLRAKRKGEARRAAVAHAAGSAQSRYSSE